MGMSKTLPDSQGLRAAERRVAQRDGQRVLNLLQPAMINAGDKESTIRTRGWSLRNSGNMTMETG